MADTTPPVDRAALREAVVNVFVRLTHGSVGSLADGLGVQFSSPQETWRHDCERIADALLALPPQGKPWAWGVVPANGERAVYEVSTAKDHAQAMADTRNSPHVARQLPPEHIPYRVGALYAHREGARG